MNCCPLNTKHLALPNESSLFSTWSLWTSSAGLPSWLWSHTHADLCDFLWPRIEAGVLVEPNSGNGLGHPISSVIPMLEQVSFYLSPQSLTQSTGQQVHTAQPLIWPTVPCSPSPFLPHLALSAWPQLLQSSWSAPSSAMLLPVLYLSVFSINNFAGFSLLKILSAMKDKTLWNNLIIINIQKCNLHISSEKQII